MCKSGTVTVLIWIIFFAVSSVSAETPYTGWEDVSDGIREAAVHSVAAGPGGAVYAAASGAVYRTDDNGKWWDEVFSVRGTGNAVNVVAASPRVRGMVYAGTDDGLYRSVDGGGSWDKIFTGLGGAENAVLSMAVHPGEGMVLFAGTRDGLFISEDGGKEWRGVRGLPSGSAVHAVTAGSAGTAPAYAATDRGLYKSMNRGTAWTRVYAMHSAAAENGTAGEDSAGTYEEQDRFISVTSLAVSPSDHGTVYAGTTRGLLMSADDGLTWKTAGSRHIRCLVFDPLDGNSVYAATDRGVFRYSAVTGKWEELYRGMAGTEIGSLSVSTGDRAALWAATDRGVFAYVLRADREGSGENESITDEIKTLFSREPSIGEIREAAITYAEVHPDKIGKWRKAAARRAWLPDVRVGYDRSRDWQSSTYFYSTSSQKYKDDDITSGDDSGWSVSLTWELGDLIWNNDQTSIDSRSRLVVQLRGDVLNEVTRLYFERRRLQLEMIASPPVDAVSRMEKELRLEELTAGIDALTGSYLSGRLNAAPERQSSLMN